MDPATFARLHALARRYVASRPSMRSHVDDLHQVAAEAVWRSGATDRALVTTVAWREMHDYARTTMRGTRSSTEAYRAAAHPASLDALTRHPVSADDPAGQACDRATLARALARMEPRGRLACLASAAGWPLRRVGEALGVSEGRAFQLRARARKTGRSP